MKNKYYYKCIQCETIYQVKIKNSIEEVIYTCPKDNHNLEVLYDYKAIRSLIKEKIKGKNKNPIKYFQKKEKSIGLSMFKYEDLLPISLPKRITSSLLYVGMTPLYRFKSIEKKYNIAEFYIKDDSRNPTGSLKDRASALITAIVLDKKEITRRHAVKEKDNYIITASTGNAGAALAGMTAAAGLKSIILAPASAPKAKIAQLLIYGAKVILVDGSYDDAFDLSVKAAEKFGWYCRNTGYNPFTVEGKKTVSFEIAEQFTNFEKKAQKKNLKKNYYTVPDLVIVSVGDGNIISAVYKGFYDLRKLKYIKKIPKIIGVQSEKSSAIANAFFQKTEKIVPVSATTLADSISVDSPRDGLRALKSVKNSKGIFITVKDKEIISAISELGKIGVFSEPAAATSYAGFKKLVENKFIHAKDKVVVLNTGTGLKDIVSAMKAVDEAPIIQPNLENLQKKLVIL